MPPFEDDLFISYRHQDNELHDDNGQGWVDHFHQDLEDTLKGILVKPPKIWRDTRLPGNVYIAEHLQDRLRRTGVLVAILSPSYLNSNWCLGELREFCRLAQENGGLEIDGRLRIFKVVKTLVESGFPKEFENQTGFHFYAEMRGKEWPDEFHQGRGQNRDPRYWDAMHELAWNIKRVLAKTNPELVTPRGGDINFFSEDDSVPSKGTVYLAQVTSDLREDRDKIRRELESYKYEVLPNKEIPLTSPEYEHAVADYLKRSKLSVHLIGSRYASVPEGEENSKTIVQLQLEAALAHRDPSFARLIWIPSDLHVTDPRQQKFMAELRASSEIQSAVDLRIVKLEDMKTAIHKKLNPPPAPDINANDAPVHVYLVYDSDDRDEVESLENYLFDLGYEVIPSLAGQTWTQEYHDNNLKLCDALLFYHGQGHDSWLARMRTEFLRARGLRQGKPFYAKAVYLSSPENDFKRRFKTHEALVIRSYYGFNPAELSLFLTEINRAKGVAQ